MSTTANADHCKTAKLHETEIDFTIHARLFRSINLEATADGTTYRAGIRIDVDSAYVDPFVSGDQVGIPQVFNDSL